MTLDAAANIAGASVIGTLNITVSGSSSMLCPELNLGDWITATIAGELVEGKPEFIQAFGNRLRLTRQSNGNWAISMTTKS